MLTAPQAEAVKPIPFNAEVATLARLFRTSILSRRHQPLADEGFRMSAMPRQSSKIIVTSLQAAGGRKILATKSHPLPAAPLEPLAHPAAAQ